MTFQEKNRLAEYLGKCLTILPNDKYIKKMYDNLINDFFYDNLDGVYTNRHIGKLKDLITQIIDFDGLKYKPSQLRKYYPSYEFHYFFMESMPKDLLNKKLYLLANFKSYDNNPLFIVTKNIINDEIKKFYQNNKLHLHIK